MIGSSPSPGWTVLIMDGQDEPKTPEWNPMYWFLTVHSKHEWRGTLTLDSQVQWGIHHPVAVVTNTGVESLLCGRQIIQGQRDVGRHVPQQLLVSKHPGDPGHRVTLHLAVQHHGAALHHLRGHVDPHRAGGVWQDKYRRHFNLRALRGPDNDELVVGQIIVPFVLILDPPLALVE